MDNDYVYFSRYNWHLFCGKKAFLLAFFTCFFLVSIIRFQVKFLSYFYAGLDWESRVEINVHLFEYAYALLCLVLLHYLSSSGSFIHILLGCFTGTWQSFHCSSFIELIPKEMGKINHSLTTNKRDPCAYIIIYCIKKQGRQHGNTSFSVWPIVFRVASLALGHWHGCSNAVELTMKYMDEIHRVSVPNPQLAMDEIPDTHRHKDICEAGVSGGLKRGHVCSKTVWWTSLLLIYHNVISPAQAKQALVKKQNMLPDKQELNDHC